MKPCPTSVKGLSLTPAPNRVEALAARAACDSMNRRMRTRMSGGVGGGAGDGSAYPIDTRTLPACVRLLHNPG